MIDIDALERLAKTALSRGQEDCESLDDWFSQEEFMSNMLLHPVDARFAEACTPRSILALIAEVRALRDAIKKQAHAAIAGMDSAKRTSTIQLKLAEQARAESSPEVLASERAMNAMLTEENETLRDKTINECAAAVADLAGEEYSPGWNNAISDAVDRLNAMRGAK